MSDPPRLVDPDSGSSFRLRLLLRVARAQRPDEDRLQAILAGISPALGGVNGSGTHGQGTHGAGGASTASGGAVAAAGLKISVLAKVGVATVVTLGAATGGYLTTRPSVPSTAAREVATVLAGSPAPSMAIAAPAAASRPTDEPHPSEPPMPVAASAPAIPTQSASPADKGVGEIALLDAAQDVLPSDPAAALALADRHASLFPHGALAQEREVIAIEALTRLDRSDEARRRARRFAHDYPRSAHWPRIESLLGDSPSHNP